MTWQEELRKLDEELAAGNLTADEYRARRDRVLSMAVSTGDQSQAAAQPAQPQAPSTAADTQIIAPVSPPAQPDQQAGSAEATQVVSAADAAGAERTQVVPQWQQQQQQQHPNSPSGGFPQPMQQPPYAQHSPAGGFAQPMQQQQQNPWGAPQQDASPPWGGSEFPPLAPPSNNADWISQGPESFQTQPSSGKGKKIAFAVVAVLVVAGLGFGVWALFIKDGGTGSAPPVAQSSSPQPPPAPTVKPLPEPPAPKPEPGDNSSALVTPAGTTRAGGGEFDMDKLESAKYLPTTVIEKAKSGGMTEGLLKTTKDGDVTLGLFALEMPNAQAAAAVAAEYGNAEQEGGLTVNRNLSLHGVPVYSAADSTQQVYRAVYVLYNRVIIIDSFGPSKDATLSSFKTLLTAQVQKAPPTERTNN